MIKTCVVLNGKVINVGEWDYQYAQVQTGTDENGKPIYENQATNPLPAGAVIEERDFEFDANRGWYEVGTPVPKTETQQQIDDLTLALGDHILNGGA